MNEWTIQKARQIYNIAHWSGGYFDINEQGQLVARPNRLIQKEFPEINLFKLAHELQAVGLRLPILVRFVDILRDRVDVLCSAFAQAIIVENYQGHYTAVYPIKVNQQRRVVEEIIKHGNGRVGLEAGSKPELIAVLALIPNNGVIICNGYKDRAYIRLALIGIALGHRVHIVVEKLSELALIIEESHKLGIIPIIGLRLRLASIGVGKWQNTGGEKAKFGLSSAQVLQVIECLKAASMLECLQLLHVHMGSQIANIRDIQRGIQECARYYADLHRLGVNIRTVDVGGGLGIDYEGNRSRSFCSMNYSVEEYANNVVHILGDVCQEQNLPYPDIFTEAGRAMTAHHAMLITNVIDIEQMPNNVVLTPPKDDDLPIIRDLWAGLQNLSSRSALEAYHDAVHWLGEMQSMYVHGILTLEQRARAEELYFATCRAVQPLLLSNRVHRDVLDELNDKLADKYFCNFSVFQSIPDAWAIDQIFPILPLHRLDEEPTQRGVIEDLTCDSDGRIDYYVDYEGIESSLPLHSIKLDEPYLLGIFLVGAYQEILGDMHNLFGDTDSVNIEINSESGYRLVDPQGGDTTMHLLEYVNFDQNELLRIFRQKIASYHLDNKQRSAFLKELETGLSGYTYLT